MLTLDVARDAVARQFTLGEPVTTPVAQDQDPAAGPTRTRLAGVLHRVADALAPASYSPAH